MHVLVVNCGSSSLKFQLIALPDEQVVAKGIIERIGQEVDAQFSYETEAGEFPQTAVAAADHTSAMTLVIRALSSGETAVLSSEEDVGAFGHRVVHGGERFTGAVRINADVIDCIDECIPLAPLHNPAAVAGLESAMAEHPEVPHVAVFDTAFHATMPAAAYTYAIDQAVAREHRIRRYGFHGTSHKYVTAKAAEVLGKPVDQVDLVTLHLGNGASACAVRGGRSVETSMGLTPLEGLVMGTRSGDIDPALFFHLITTAGMTADEVDAMLNKRSGLLGLCGQNDLREVHALAARGNRDAELALSVYVHRIRKYLGAYLAVLGRADAIVFTAGVGENDPEIRRRVISGLELIGVAIDQERNAATRGPSAPVDLSFRGAPIRVLVVPTNEELEIARQTAQAVTGRA